MKSKLFTLLLVVAASIGTILAWDYENVQIGDLYYNLDATNKTAEVTSQNSDYPYWSTTITTANIPAAVTYNSVSYSVTSIGESAFFYCTGLTSVTIPNSVTSIGGWAFKDCTGLTSVTIPNSVKSIGEVAFSGCSSLTSVTIGNSVTSIGAEAFHGCTRLTSVTIPNSVTSIGDRAFYGCTGLTSVTIPNSVTSIGNHAFCDCSGLTSITIPNSVTSIGGWAFADCSSLTSVIIPNSVTSIGRGAFWRCSALTSITMDPLSPPIIDEDSWPGDGPVGVIFDECYNIENIYVPCGRLDTYQTADLWSNYASKMRFAPLPYIINTNAEKGNIATNIDSLTICDEPFVTCTATPDRGYYFVKWADGNTDNPRTIELTQDTTMEAIFAIYTKGKCGDHLTWTYSNYCLNIHGSGAMWNDGFEETWYASRENIQLINLPPNITNIGNGVFAGCTNLASVNIPNAVTSVGEWAFSGCTGLNDVVLGTAVKVLEIGAFNGCNYIETITCYSMRPPTVKDYALNGLPYSTIVYVMADYLNTYVMHDAWGLYDVRPLGATTTQTTDLTVTPDETTANVTWPAVQGAYTYELVIKDRSGNTVCTLVFNANGQLTAIAFNAPARDRAPQQPQANGFEFTVTGLDRGTGYDLTMTSKDSGGSTLDQKTVSFTTTTETTTGIDQVRQQKTVNTNKVIRNGILYIERDGKTYNAHGARVR